VTFSLNQAKQTHKPLHRTSPGEHDFKPSCIPNLCYLLYLQMRTPHHVISNTVQVRSYNPCRCLQKLVRLRASYILHPAFCILYFVFSALQPSYILNTLSSSPISTSRRCSGRHGHHLGLVRYPIALAMWRREGACSVWDDGHGLLNRAVIPISVVPRFMVAKSCSASIPDVKMMELASLLVVNHDHLPRSFICLCCRAHLSYSVCVLCISPRCCHACSAVHSWS
jgi:hypothetical protein